MRGSIDGMMFQLGSASRRPAAFSAVPCRLRSVNLSDERHDYATLLNNQTNFSKQSPPGKVLLSITSIVQRTDQALRGAVMLTLCAWREALIRPSTEISCYFFSKEDTFPEDGLQESAKGSLSFVA